MSNETVANYAAKRANNAMERLAELEAKLGRMESLLKLSSEKADAAVVLCDAISDIVGSDAVAAKVQENQLRRAQVVAEEQAKSVTMAIENKIIVPAEVVADESLVVLVEKDKEGNVVPPGRLQLWFRDLTEDFKAKFLGAKVGDVVEGLLERTATVAEVYNPAPAAPKEAAAQ